MWPWSSITKPEPVPAGWGSERKPGGTTELMTVTTDGRVSWYTRTVVSVAAWPVACCCGCAKAGAVTTAGPPGVVRPGRGACPTTELMLLPTWPAALETFETTGAAASVTVDRTGAGPAMTSQVSAAPTTAAEPSLSTPMRGHLQMRAGIGVRLRSGALVGLARAARPPILVNRYNT